MEMDRVYRIERKWRCEILLAMNPQLIFRERGRGLSKWYLESYSWPLFATELNPQSSAYRMQYALIMDHGDSCHCIIRTSDFWPRWRTSAWSAVSMRIILSSISDLYTLWATIKGFSNGTHQWIMQCLYGVTIDQFQLEAWISIFCSLNFPQALQLHLLHRLYCPLL